MRKIILLSLMVALSAQTFRHIELAVPTFAIIPRKVILIDAGHGGWDPGMTVDGTIVEKSPNLEISAKLQAILEQAGAFVINTRVQDEALGDRKSSDLAGRREIADTGNADIMISIHQNSFTDESVRGAQVFYYSLSEESKRLATYIQAEIKNFVQTSNHREPKADSSYYILKKTTIPAVIVECGFLSNPEERQNLINPEYQEKIAWAIYLGILKYFGY